MCDVRVGSITYRLCSQPIRRSLVDWRNVSRHFPSDPTLVKDTVREAFRAVFFFSQSVRFLLSQSVRFSITFDPNRSKVYFSWVLAAGHPQKFSWKPHFWTSRDEIFILSLGFFSRFGLLPFENRVWRSARSFSFPSYLLFPTIPVSQMQNLLYSLKIHSFWANCM